MDRRRNRGAGERGGQGRRGRPSPNASKRAGYLPRNRSGQQTKDRGNSKNSSSRRRRQRRQYAAASHASGAQSSWGGGGGGGGGAGTQIKRSRRDRDVDSHSSDQYLSLSTDDNGDYGRGGNNNNNNNNNNNSFGTGQGRDDGRNSSRKRSGRSGGGAGASGRAANTYQASRPRRFRGRQQGEEDRPQRGGVSPYDSHSASWTPQTDSFGSSYDSYRYEDTREECVGPRRPQSSQQQQQQQQRRRQSRDAPDAPRGQLVVSARGGGGSGGDNNNRVNAQTQRTRQRRDRSHSPPPEPRQRPHQPHQRKYARQEAGPQSAAAAHNNNNNGRDQRRSDSGRDRNNKNNYDDDDDDRSRSVSTLASLSSRGSSTRNRRPRGGAQAAKDHVDGEVVSPPLSTPTPALRQPSPANPPGTSEQQADEAKLTAADREERYLEWLYAKPDPKPGSNSNSNSNNAHLTHLTGGVATLSRVVPDTSGPSNAAWDQVTVENRFLVTSDRSALRLVDWRGVRESLAEARLSRAANQSRAEEESEGELAARDRPPPLSRNTSFLAWAGATATTGTAAAAGIAAHTPLRLSLQNSAVNTPRGPRDAQTAPSSLPVTPFHTPQSGTPARTAAVAGGGGGDGAETPLAPLPPPPLFDENAPTAAMATGQSSAAPTPQLLHVLPSAALDGNDALHSTTIMPPAALERLTPQLPASGNATPRLSRFYSAYDIGAEAEWIPESWRTVGATGVVYPSQLFLRRWVFLERADAESARVFQRHFDTGFAHRQPPWFICSDLDSNAELPWGCEWMNQLPSTPRTLAEQITVSRANIAAQRAQVHKPEEEERASLVNEKPADASVPPSSATDAPDTA